MRASFLALAAVPAASYAIPIQPPPPLLFPRSAPSPPFPCLHPLCPLPTLPLSCPASTLLSLYLLTFLSASAFSSSSWRRKNNNPILSSLRDYCCFRKWKELTMREEKEKEVEDREEDGRCKEKNIEEGDWEWHNSVDKQCHASSPCRKRLHFMGYALLLAGPIFGLVPASAMSNSLCADS